MNFLEVHMMGLKEFFGSILHLHASDQEINIFAVLQCLDDMAVCLLDLTQSWECQKVMGPCKQDAIMLFPFTWKMVSHFCRSFLDNRTWHSTDLISME